MTIEKAINILHIMRKMSAEDVFAMPVAKFQAIVTLIEDAQYTMYKNRAYNLEQEMKNLESAWFQRQAKTEQ